MKINCLVITFARSTSLVELISRVKKNCDKVYIYQNMPNMEFESDCARVTRLILSNLGDNVEYFRPEKFLTSEESIIYAISYFFRRVDCGTIFEDDCLPSEKFWQSLRFFNTTKRKQTLFALNGFNPSALGDGKCEFLKKKYLHVWGWTTNSDTWREFLKQTGFERKIDIKILWGTHQDAKVVAYWYLLLRLVKNKKIRSWDYKFTYFLWRNNIHIYGPSENFIKNMGADRFSQFMKDDPANISGIPVFEGELDFVDTTFRYDENEWRTNETIYLINFGTLLRLVFLNIRHALLNR